MQKAEFVLKNIFLKFDSQIKQQDSETAIGSKCATMYAYIFMDKVEIVFRDTKR